MDLGKVTIDLVKTTTCSSNRSKKTDDDGFQKVLDKTVAKKEKPIEDKTGKKEETKENRSEKEIGKEQSAKEENKEEKVIDPMQVVPVVLPFEQVATSLQSEQPIVMELPLEESEQVSQPMEQATAVESVVVEQLGQEVIRPKEAQTTGVGDDPTKIEPERVVAETTTREIPKEAKKTDFDNVLQKKEVVKDISTDENEVQGKTLDNRFIASKAKWDKEQPKEQQPEQSLDLNNAVHILNKVEQPQGNSPFVAVSDIQKQQEIVLTNPEEMNQKLSDTMVKNIMKNNNEFELQLEPANLGKLTIKVVYEAGKTAISITCTNGKSLEALAQQSKEIASIMEEKLGEPTVVFVEDKENGNYLQQERQQQNQNQQQQEESHAQSRQSKQEEKNRASFLQQLRLGLM